MITERIELAPGESRQVDAAVPALQSWVARVASLTPLGAHARIALVRIAGVSGLGAVNDDGIVPLMLPVPPHLEDKVEICLFALKMIVPAHIAAIDAAQHTFAIEPDITAADVIQLDSRGLGEGARQIWLANHAPAIARPPAWLGDSATVPMLPGSERNGCLLETVGGRKQLTSWFTLHHGARNVVVEPAGHWVTLRLQRQVARVRAFVVGWPDMEPVEVAGMAEPGEQRLFVADGTVAIRVDVGVGASTTFAPELTEMVVR
jgi:hypothetical protein